MYYTIYKITNQIDGKIYIGSHKTENLDDNYMGSGKYLIAAQKKYGIENFVKEILFVFDTALEMYAKEAELVNEDFIATENTYNLKVGGFGGWDYVNTNGASERVRNHNFSRDYSKLITSGHYHKMSNAGNSRIKELMSTNGGKAWWNSASFTGKTHSDETKRKIGEANSEKAKGSNNSQYGTIWIYSNALKACKKILKTEAIPDGWQKGRKIKF